MTQLKWLVLMGAAAFVICTGMSLFLPPPPNPARHAALAIEERMPIPADTQALLKRACYDCHSNETRWPIYSRVWPASAMIYADVSAARKVMNFSEWPSLQDPHEARRAAGLLMASCAAMQGGLMPMPRYLALHPEAKISADDSHRFCAWTAMETAAIHKH